MSSSTRTRVPAALIAVAAIVLAGCSSGESELSHFEHAQSSEDVVEDGTGILDSVDAESTRFLATDGRGSFYAAQQAGSQNLCVVAVHAGSRLPMLSCTSADTVEVYLGDVVYVLGPRAQPGEGWEELAERFWRR